MANLYEANGNVYEVEGGVAYPANITAKDKVIEIRELEAVAVKREKDEVELPPTARPVTIDEIIAKFNVSEKHPCKFDMNAHEQCFVVEDETEGEVEGSDDQKVESENDGADDAQDNADSNNGADDPNATDDPNASDDQKAADDQKVESENDGADTSEATTKKSSKKAAKE